MRNLRSQEEIMANWLGDQDKPVVSICCITYNHESFINDAFQGFLIQETGFPFEILIHDDASTDHTADIIREYEKKYPKLIKPIYQTENQYSRGKKVNFEFNFPRARGCYIALCEGDDYWTESDKLQKQFNFLENNLDYVITYTSVEAFNEKGEINNYLEGVTRDVGAIELQKAIAINTPTAFFRNLITHFPPEFGCAKIGDLLIWSLLGEHGKGKYLNDIKSTKYRVHDGGVYSKKTYPEQRRMAYTTYFSLYSYYLRINNQYLSSYFLNLCLNDVIEAHGCINFATILIRHCLKSIKYNVKGFIIKIFCKNIKTH